MPRSPTVGSNREAREAPMKMQAVLNGIVVAEGDRTVIVEGNHYFPADDVDADYLQPYEKKKKGKGGKEKEGGKRGREEVVKVSRRRKK